MTQPATKLGGFDAYLMEKNQAQLEAVRQEAFKEGWAQGRAESLMILLKARGLTVTDAEQQRLEQATEAELQAYLCRAVPAVQPEAIFEEDQTA